VERVEGIGGFFFGAGDPEGLAAWYAEHLGVPPPPVSYDAEVWVQRAGPTVFAPFPTDQGESSNLGRSGWGINFRVGDLDAIGPSSGPRASM
jgi:glyoxylase I family protein